MSPHRSPARPRRTSRLRASLAVLAAAALAAPLAGLALATPASAHGGKDRIARLAGAGSASAGLIMSDNIEQVGENPSQVAISGCFMHTAPVFVTSGVDSVRVYDVSDPLSPTLTGVLPRRRPGRRGPHRPPARQPRRW